MSSSIVQGAILAAGEGSRLRADGWAAPKPLVTIAGVPLIEHVLGNFAAAGIRRVAIIFNAQSPDCAELVRRRFPSLELRVLVKSTASSFESLRELSALLDPGPALFSTVDAWCPRGDFLAFARAAETLPSETVLAVTPFVQDERPLRVRTEPTGRVLAIGGDSGDAVTAGMYSFSDEARARAAAGDFPRLRDYLSWLAASGIPMRAWSIPKVIDIDRAEDVESAERLAESVAPSPRRPVSASARHRVPASPTAWAIYRELAHSPGRETDDAEILQAVARRLRASGFSVALRTAEEIAESEPDTPAFLFVMCEQPAILRTLERWEERGAISINSSAAIANTYRDRMVARLERSGVPFPASRLVPTSAPAAPALAELGASELCWVKRGDVHNTQEGDVVFAPGAREADAALQAMSERGIPTAVLQRHVPGDLIKFYGISPSPRRPVAPSPRPSQSPRPRVPASPRPALAPRPPIAVSPRPTLDHDGGPSAMQEKTADPVTWFQWFYHRDQRLARYAFDAEELRAITERAASCLELEIYGGDAIVTERGEIFVIDVNAWPSFALYRETAAARIAEYLASRFENPVQVEASE